MRILITNDDGIHAPGLAVLETIAKTLSDEVWVVAPETDQSGVSHSLTLNDPLRLRTAGERRFAIKGTPTDCVIMGVRHLMEGNAPDLILSGVNRGQNIAEDVVYSGTVAGAMEGALLGFRSIALSQAYDLDQAGEPRWDVAEAHGAGVIRKLVEVGIPAGIVMNVNFPGCRPGEVEGIAVTEQGARNQALMRIEARKDGRGNPYFWIAFHRQNYEPKEGMDLWAMRHKQISVTPLKLNLTDHAAAEDLRAALR